MTAFVHPISPKVATVLSGLIALIFASLYLFDVGPDFTEPAMYLFAVIFLLNGVVAVLYGVSKLIVRYVENKIKEIRKRKNH